MSGIQLFAAAPRRRAKASSRDPHASPTEESEPQERRTQTQDVIQIEDGAGGAAIETVAGEGQDADAEWDHATEGTTFRSLGLSAWLCGVLQGLKMTKPSEVQRKVIPQILAGRNVIGCAQTGSGKTAAFALPILHQLAKDPYGVYALALTPTRELAFQISEQFAVLGAGMSLRVAVIIGGLDMQRQVSELTRRPHVVVATPGRLAEIIAGDLQARAAFARTKTLVLDEADRLLAPTFEDSLATILGVLPAQGRQMLLFSATLTQSIEDLRAAMGGGGAAAGPAAGAYFFRQYEGLRTAGRLTEELVFVPAKVKEVYLAHILSRLDADWGARSCIVFTGTTRTCLVLELLLRELGVAAVALHSNKAQRFRIAALGKFKARAASVLVATDVASRGLDIPSVDLVINYDLPRLPADYVHRVGRTARAGRAGRALSLVSQHEVRLVQAIEDVTGVRLEPHAMDEGEVLQGISKVFAARRAALLKAVEIEQEDPVLQQKLAIKAREREEKRKGEEAEGEVGAARREGADDGEERTVGVEVRKHGLRSRDVRRKRRKSGAE